MPTAAFTRIIQLLTLRYAEPLTLTELAGAAGVPKTTLTREFNGRYQLSPMRWVWLVRTVMAAELIAATPTLPLRTVARLCGFNSQAHFCRRFMAAFHESPAHFRQHFRQHGLGHALTPAAALQQAVHKVNQVASASKDKV